MLTTYNTKRKGTTLYQVTENDDLAELIASYMPAAEALGITQGEVEEAVVNALRFVGRCTSCCHSRAPWNVLGTAQNEERLDIHERSCTQGCLTGLKSCGHYEPLEKEES